MNNHEETIQTLISKLSHETRELIDYPRDLNEASWEHADNHENVTYFAKAHENVKNAGSDELLEAESRFEDCGGMGDDADERGGVYDRIAQLLSHHLEDYRFQSLVRSELEELEGELEQVECDIEAGIEEREENEQEPCKDLANALCKAQEHLEGIKTILDL